MPYKHIATHLKKTELACRLHYHQLSHGSNRRKRNTSVSSGSSAHSPVTHTNISSPAQESNSNPSSPGSYTLSPESQNVHLPPPVSIIPRLGSSSPQRTLGQPIAILPKPSSFRQETSTPPLRLDCAIPISGPLPTSIDYKCLAYIYERHRAAFWGTIAAEYGQGVDPHVLEEAWRHGNGNSSGTAFNAVTLPTPCISPEGGNTYREEKSPEVENRASATSISALLGIDASPRSPQERELIKRIEEGRMEMA